MNKITVNMEKPIIKNSNIKNFIDISIFFIGSFLFPIFLYRDIEMKEFIYYLVFLFFLECIFSILILNFYTFYDDYIEIYYPIRIGKNRRKKIYYSEIERVKYYGEAYKGNPFICIYRIGKKCKTYNPANTFSCSFKKARITLKFLQSKGIPIEIDSVCKKKQRILDE